MSRTARKNPPPLPSRQRETELRASGWRLVAGVDEAGVGPLAGPVVAAAVILSPVQRVEGICDSKLLDEAERVRLERQILAESVAAAIGQASVAEIDEIGIYQATALAMRRAVQGLALPAEYLLIDARRVELELPQEGPVHGDRDHTCIAAASILAKQFRDRLMATLDGEHPAFGFAEHKGYPTPRHLEALGRHGTCTAHRLSWLAVREAAGLLSPRYYSLLREIHAAIAADELGVLDRRLRTLRSTMDAGEHGRLRELLRRRRARRTRDGAGVDSRA